MNVRASSDRQNLSRASRRSLSGSEVQSRPTSLRRDIRPSASPKTKRSVVSHPPSSASSLPISDWRRLALEQADHGRYPEAIALLSQLLEHNPTSAVDYNNRGLVYFQSGQLDRALADYNQAIRLNPRLANVYNNRANYYATLGRLGAAIDDYDTAIDLNPSNIRAWLNQGITFRELELYDRAIENFDFALQFIVTLNQSQVLEGHLYAERGRTYHLLGDWNLAVADYQRALMRLPWLESGKLTTSQKLYFQVQTWLDELLSL